MANDFYTPTGNPVANAEILSSELRSEFSDIEDAFDKMCPLTGNELQVVRINAAGDGLEAGGLLSSGTYGPTQTLITNCASGSGGTGYWFRVGNLVTVFGATVITATASGASTIFVITLPVASTITSVGRLAGTFASHSAATSTSEVNAGVIYGDTATNGARFAYVSASTASRTFSYHFSYLVA